MTSNKLHEELISAGVEVKNDCVRKSDVMLAEQVISESNDGWEHDPNSGSWIYDPEGILLEDGTASVPTIVLENGGYNYYCKGDDYPTGFISVKEIMGDSDMSEEEAEEAALEAAKEAAMEFYWKE
jgi:hypothetical protein